MILWWSGLACGAHGQEWERELGRLYALIQQQRAAQAVTALEARCAQGRGFAQDAMSGYRQGFFFWQALGVAYQARDTLHGPDSYRALQQAAAYMPAYTDLEHRAVAEQLPAARLYLQLGMACKNIGRMHDAQNYFLAAVALGSNDWGLWQGCVSVLAGQALVEGRPKDAMVLLQDMFATTNTPSAHSYAMYAVVLLYQRKEREMFQVLAEYLQTQEMDMRTAAENPVVRMAVQMLGRAQPQEIAEIYEGLELQLTRAPLQPGCESGVARLINQRTVLARVFEWLHTESDLTNILRRVAEEEQR